MKKRQKLLTDEQWKLIGALFPEPPRRRDKRGVLGRCTRRVLSAFSVFCKPGRHGGFYPRVSVALDLPATAETVGKGESVWLTAWRTLLGALDAEGLLKWDEAFLDGSFTRRKRGLAVGKTKRGKGRSGWYWETVKVFRWDFGWKAPLRGKLRLRTPRSQKSASPGQGADRARSRNV